MAIVCALMFIGVSAVDWFGQQYFAILAMVEMQIGVLMGVALCLPARKTAKEK